MATQGERDIATIVAVTVGSPPKFHALAPCGKCRELISAFGNPYVIIQAGRNDLRKAKLEELLPVRTE